MINESEQEAIATGKIVPETRLRQAVLTYCTISKWKPYYFKR